MGRRRTAQLREPANECVQDGRLMGMVITYDSSKASPISLRNQFRMTMELVSRGLYDWKYRQEPLICADYALESPDHIPCGGCVQEETYCGTDDQGYEDFVVYAAQIAVPRYCA